MRFAVQGLLIQDRKVLMVETYTYHVFPGGKYEYGETDNTCLIREFKEELSGTDIEITGFYKIISGITAISKEPVTYQTYFCELKGELGNSSNEIDSRFFIDSRDISKLKLTDTSKKTLDSLIKDNLID